MSPADPYQLHLFEPPRPAPEPGLAPEPDVGAAPLPPSAASVGERLGTLLDGRLRRLVLTRNRSRILSARPDPGDPEGFAVRLDACFTTAPEEVLAAVGTWILGSPREREEALGEIRRFFEAARDSRPSPPRRRIHLEPVGVALDLRQIRDELNRTHFGGRVHAAITWGLAATAPGQSRWSLRRPGRRRSIRLGSYSFATDVIRIHRALDDQRVPTFVVVAVVHHEMLHAFLPPPERRGGRRRIHTPEFRRLEALFADHDRARKWIDKNLDRLLRA